MARVTAHREEHVKQCITRGSCYSTQGRTCKACITRGSCYSTQGRTCKAMHYTWLVVQHTGNELHVTRVKHTMKNM